MKKVFSIRKALSFGFTTFKARPWFFVRLYLLYYFIVGVLPNLAQFIIELLFPSASESDPNMMGALFGGVISLLFAVGSIALSLGMVHVLLDVYDGKKPHIKELFHPRGLFFPYLFLSLITGILVMLGFIFFIIPGVILGLLLAFSTYSLADERNGLFTAMTRSQQITKGARLKLLGFYIVSGVVNLIGFLCLGIGALVTLPTVALATVYVYKTLKEQTTGETNKSKVAATPELSSS